MGVFNDKCEVTLQFTTGVYFFSKNVLLLFPKTKKFKLFLIFFIKVRYISTFKISFFFKVDFL
jgi:hypothetical protein